MCIGVDQMPATSTRMSTHTPALIDNRRSMACRSTFTVITAVALLSLAACGDDTATSGTASESSTGASGGMSFSATSAEPTGDPEPEVTR
ncbi:hypothetical protein OV203_50620, partial [Nannocystis sp. ILAH1]